MNLKNDSINIRKGGRMSCLLLLFALGISSAATAQFSIVGQTCAVPGVLLAYNISGGFSTADKWCITGGTVNGVSNGCVANTGSPTVSVMWATGASTGTISYYHPATNPTPVATLNVTLQDGGSVSPGAVFVPSGVNFTFTITGTAPTQSCFPLGGYEWEMGPNPSSLSVISGQTGPNLTMTGTWTSSFFVQRLVSCDGAWVPCNPVSIIPQTAFTPGTISVPSSCVASGSSPGTLTGTTASGGNCGSGGTFFYQWQTSSDNVNWTNAGSSTSSQTGYTPGALTATTYFRQLESCGPLSLPTNILTVNVYQALAAGTISTGPENINYNTSPGIINCSAASGGSCSPSYVYQWQQSTDNVNWSNVSSGGSDPGTSQNYTPGSLTTSTYFRQHVSTGGQSASSSSLLITVYPAMGAGAISPSGQAINYNTAPAALSVSGVSGGNGSYSYQWYTNASGSYQAIGGATASSYTPPVLTATTSYEVVVNSNGATATTTPVTVIVYPALVSGTISPATQTINYGVIPGALSVSSPSGGNGSYSYQWQSCATASGTYTSISGAGGTSYTPGILNSTTYYEVVTTSNGVSVTSAPVVVIVNLSGGTIGVPGAVTYGATTAVNSIQDANGGSCNNSYSYQWMQSTDGTNYQAIAGAMGNTYTTGNLTYPVWLVRQATCGSATALSNALNVPVQPPLNGGAVTPGSEAVTSGGSAGLLTASEAWGGNCGGSYAYQWQSSTDGINFSNVGVSAQNYNPGVVGATTYFRRQVICGSELQYTNVDAVTVVTATDTPTLNYIRVRDLTKPGITNFQMVDALSSTWDMRQNMRYFDGIDRLMQTVNYQASPRGFDQVKPTIYDAYGREAVGYLPYTSPSNDGLYKANALAEQNAFNSTQYPNDQYYYGQTDFEASPLNRPLMTYPEGNSWIGAGRGMARQYQLNTVQDSVQMWDIGFAAGSLPFSIGIYGVGQLYKNVTIDEQGHQVIEYKDKEGHVVLKKVQSADSPGSAHVGWLCTYYVYDDLTNVRFVIPPRAVEIINTGAAWTVSQPVADELCYRYEFDYRDRMSVKKIPGAGATDLVYDLLDRPVASQDSNLRAGNQWLVTLYDGMDRPVETGLIVYAASQPVMQQTETSQTPGNPVPSGVTLQPQTFTYYDDYAWVAGTGTGLTSGFASGVAGNGNYFITTYNTSPTYALPVTPYATARGKITGMQTLVLGTTSQYLYSVNFYDERSRLVQTQSVNYTGGLDTVTMQYDFGGKPLRTLFGQAKLSNTAQYHEVLTKMNYDPMSRVTSVWKNIDHAAGDQMIDSMQYDELGRLRTKYLGGNAISGGPLDSLVYDYNIRDWVTGINKQYVAGTAHHYFGMELGYDNLTSASGRNYATPVYNGNIAGSTWRSAGDGVSRRYDFTYDNMNRLTGAAYLDNHSGSEWDHNAMDYTVSGLAYDGNGNILAMNQDGFKIGNPTGAIDVLTYSYQQNSNKLSQVNDAANDTASVLGDFHYKGNKGAFDYTYDGNGNLVLDNNKGVDAIVYNYLNLPQLIHMKGKGKILYTYDAGGNRLQKQTIDSMAGVAITTLYMDGFQYQRRTPIASPGSGVDTLQFVAHDEGRARWAFHKHLAGDSVYAWEYDFMEKDHLGNTRVLLTQEKDTAQYMATMEANYRNTERALFYGIDSTSYARSSVSGYPTDVSVTNPNDSVARVNGNGPKVGPAIILKVMAGDKVDIGVQYYYNSMSNSNGPALQPKDLLNSLASGLATLSAPAHGALSTLSNPNSSPLLAALTSSIDSQNASGTNKPHAYLNWVLLDNQFNYVGGNDQSGALQVGAAGAQSSGQLQPRLAYTGLPMSKSGYLYIYVSNATPGWDVFFDNLSVITYSGPMLEENHYYPFGLTMAGISDKAVKTNYADNKYRYNKGSELQNKEFSDGSGLEMYETHLRELDPQLGRWWQLDGKPDYSMSLYSAMGNNPVLHNDPLGDSIIGKANNAVANRIVSRSNEEIAGNNAKISANTTTIGKNMATLVTAAMGGAMNKKELKAAVKSINNLKKENTELHAQNDYLNTGLSAIGDMRRDLDHNYTFESPASDDGTHHVSQGKGKNVIVEGSNDGLFLHESVHIEQHLTTGGLRFAQGENNKGLLLNVGATGSHIGDEVQAYRVQFSYDRSFSTSFAKELQDINPATVRDLHSGDYYPYRDL